MSLDYEYAQDGTRATLTVSGVVEEQEIAEGIRSIYADPARTARYRHVFYDYTGVQSFRMSRTGVQLLAEVEKVAAQINPKLVLCIAAPDNLLSSLEKLWRVHATFENPWRIEVFLSRADAEQWMNTH
jgi:hypothetical protein